MSNNVQKKPTQVQLFFPHINEIFQDCRNKSLDTNKIQAAVSNADHSAIERRKALDAKELVKTITENKKVRIIMPPNNLKKINATHLQIKKYIPVEKKDKNDDDVQIVGEYLADNALQTPVSSSVTQTIQNSAKQVSPNANTKQIVQTNCNKQIIQTNCNKQIVQTNCNKQVVQNAKQILQNCGVKQGQFVKQTNVLLGKQIITNNQPVLIHQDKSVTVLPKPKPIILNHLANTLTPITLKSLGKQKLVLAQPGQVKPNAGFKYCNVILPKKPAMKIIVHKQTQTEVIVNDCASQTEAFSLKGNSAVTDSPNITELVEFLLDVPEYSSGIDELKKSELLDMSRNTLHNDTMATNFLESKSFQAPKVATTLKMHLFVDMKDCDHFDVFGNLPIHKAILENNASYVKRQCFAMKLRGVSINTENREGMIPLQLAIINNSDSAILFTLLDNGANLHKTDSEGNTVLHLAVINSTQRILSILLKYCDAFPSIIDLKNDDGITPLMLSVINSKCEMLDVLLKNGAIPNIRDEKSGRTALFHAIEASSNAIIALLLRYKADPKIRNFFGLTPLDVARDLNLPEAELLDHNVSASTGTSNKQLPTSELKKNPIAGSVLVPKKRTVSEPLSTSELKKSKLLFIKSFQKIELKQLEGNAKKL